MAGHEQTTKLYTELAQHPNKDFDGDKGLANEFRQTHWDTLFRTKDYTQVLWHQESPIISFNLIIEYASKEDFIIDVGCGASFLVDNLIECLYKNLTLLDISQTSLEIVKKRLQENGSIPTYICSDILNFQSSKKFNIWHDRAVFHFLLQKNERDKYFEILKDSLHLGGVAIISTFRVGGQTQCAGLDIVQYDEDKMRAELPQGLELLSYDEFVHHTPKQTQQEYCAFLIRKTSES
jgi:arsenite methyltransferase